MMMLRDPPEAATDMAQVVEVPETDGLVPDLEPEPKVEPLSPVGRPKILVGTASWTDPTLIKCGRFYPKGCSSAEARLRYYATRFPLVEVNSSYYALPSRSNSELWVERTPADFTFNVKAFRLFTGHQTPVDALPVPVRAALGTYSKKNIYYKDMPRELLDSMWSFFSEAIEPLRAAKKLGAVHFQFAPWFVCASQARDHLDEVRSRLAEYTLSVEFRHESWFNEKHREQTLDFEKERGLVNVVLDEPQGFANSVGAHWVVTNSALAVLRLHGRNAQTWNIKGATAASDRFNYDYSDQELEGLSDSIRDMAAKVGAMHVVFNNNYEDQGQRNATTLMRLLDLVS
jgi:uncharacterized protein YecE (DUF72 family)